MVGRLSKTFEYVADREYVGNVARYASLAEFPRLPFRILFGKPELKLKDGSITHIVTPLFFRLLGNKGRLVDSECGLYEWKLKGKTVYATNDQITGFYEEYTSGEFGRIYQHDWRGKAVLDIGGFIGDSALYFLENGASCVEVYEPVQQNLCAIRHNLKKFGGKVRVFQEAVGAKDGKIEICSADAPGTVGFGGAKGGFKMTAKCAALPAILAKGKFDVVKMDCEGCEVCLFGLGCDALARVHYWIIEIHAAGNVAKMEEKFRQCGFSTVKKFVLNKDVCICHFAKT